MGLAAQHLSAGDLERIAAEILSGARVQGEHVWGACPFHSEATPGNAFYYTPAKDMAHCHGCGQTGDLIDVFGAVQSLDGREACRQFLARYAPQALTSGGGASNRNRTPAMPGEQKSHRIFDGGQVKDPAKIWLEHAGKLVGWARSQLKKNSEHQYFLQARGIVPEAAERYRLGLIPEDAWRERAAWGLPAKYRDDGKPKKLWIPAGIVVPYFEDGRLHRVRIRRFEGEPRYYWLEGSGTRTSCWACTGENLPGRAAVVVETELDGIAVHAAAGDLVRVVALGSSSSKPKGLAYDLLKTSDVILFAGDCDQAGAEAWAWWSKAFPQVQLWPVPAGKDPGDAVRDHGLDLRQWVMAGLPPAWTIGLLASCQVVQGAGIEDVQGGEGAPEDEPGPEAAKSPESQEAPASVQRLYEILCEQDIVLVKGDGQIGCYPKKKRAGRWVEDALWWHKHPELGQELQELCWFDVAVEAYLSGHPDEKINRKNFFYRCRVSGVRKNKRRG